MCHAIPGTLVNELIGLQISAATVIAAETNRCTINDTYVQGGVSDVASVQNLRVIESSGRKYDIVSSDIELPHRSKGNMEIIMLNITTFFVRNRNPFGIFVSQIRADTPKAMYQALVVFRRYCHHVHLLKSHASTRHEQCFLLAWGCLTQDILEYLQPPGRTECDLIISVNEFCNSVQNDHETRSNHINVFIRLNHTIWAHYRPWFYALTWRIHSRLQKKLQLSSSWERTVLSLPRGI